MTLLVSELHCYPVEDRAMQKQPIRIDHCCFEFDGIRSGDSESLLLIGEQEVGIT